MYELNFKYNDDLSLYLEINTYSRFRLIGPPVNRVSRLIGPNCEERNPIKENALLYIRIIGPLFRLIGPQL